MTAPKLFFSVHQLTEGGMATGKPPVVELYTEETLVALIEGGLHETLGHEKHLGDFQLVEAPWTTLGKRLDEERDRLKRHIAGTLEMEHNLQLQHWQRLSTAINLGFLTGWGAAKGIIKPRE